MNKNEFKEKYCSECTSDCEKGITETSKSIYCADLNIKETKLKNENCKYYKDKNECKILSERVCKRKECSFYKECKNKEA